jgi:beta-phosphoglucomutase family hydrolase
MLGAVIFDFDGVIVDSESLHYRAFNLACAQFRIEISTKDYYDKFLGLTDSEVFCLLSEEKKLGWSPEQVERLVEQKTAAFKQLAKTKAQLMPGVREFIQMLKDNRIPTAISSGALLPEIELILQGAGLRDFFEIIVSAEQVKHGKPHPEGFLLALAKLNEKPRGQIRPNQCIVLEDSRWGLQAAKAAGMHPVAVANTYEPKQLRPAEKIIANLSELSLPDLYSLCG